MHLLEIILDQSVVGVGLQASKTGYGSASVVPPAATSKPSRAFRQEEDTETERHGESDAQSNNNPPRSRRFLDLPDAVIDQIRNQDADSDQQLIGSDDSATDLTRAAFGLVHRHTHGKVTDTQPSHEASHHHVHPGSHSSDLDDVADNEHTHPERQALAATPPIRGIGAAKGTDEGSNTHEGNHKGKDDVVEGPVPWWALAEPLDEVGENLHSGYLTLRTRQKKSRDEAFKTPLQAYRIIAEQETTDRGDHTQKNSFETAVGAIDAYLPIIINVSRLPAHIQPSLSSPTGATYVLPSPMVAMLYGDNQVES